MSTGAIIAVGAVGVMVCCSASSAAAVMMGGDGESNVGKVCTPQGTPDPNATYKYGANDACLMTCKTGYEKKDGACVEKNPGPEMLKCISTQRRDEMGWEHKGRVKTEAEARNLCSGKKYMSLECPTADGFEVFCVDDISLAETLLDRECKGDVTGTSIANGTNAHCVGPYKWGDVHGGGASRGALYEI